MGHRIALAASFWLLVVALPATAADLEQALDALAVAAEQEGNLSPEFKDALAGLIGALRDSPRAGVEAESPTPDVAASGEPTFWDRLHPSADLRIRYEHDGNRPGTGGDSSRNRARARFRLGATYDLLEEVMVGFRVRTGNPDDPNSPHQTFNSMFDSWEFEIDRAYIQYRPDWLEGAWAQAGKFAMPFKWNPVYGELVWDADVNPEGFAAGFDWSDGNGLDLGVALGEYVLVEQGTADEATLFAMQGHGSYDLSEDLTARLAVSWYRYANLTPDSSAAAVTDNMASATANSITFGDFDSQFHIVNPIASLTWTGWRFPLTVSGEYIHNTKANRNTRDDGWAVGAKLDAKVAGHKTKIFYQYQYVNQDAVFASFAQDDQLHASNFDGHVFGVDFGITHNLGLRAWGLISETLQASGPSQRHNDQHRLRLDLNANF